MNPEEPVSPDAPSPTGETSKTREVSKGEDDREAAGLIDALTLRALFLAGAILLAITAYWAVHRH